MTGGFQSEGASFTFKELNSVAFGPKKYFYN